MKGFRVTDGDISITDGKIDMVEDDMLEVQTMQTVLQTNKGEDVFDSSEGIDFYQILGKGVTEDMVRSQIQSGMNQVNSEYAIEDFDYTADKTTRKSTVDFTARKPDGTSISVSNNYS